MRVANKIDQDGKRIKLNASEVVVDENNPKTIEDFINKFKDSSIEYLSLPAVLEGGTKHSFDMPVRTTRLFILHANSAGHFTIINATRFASGNFVHTKEQFGGSEITVTRNSNGDRVFLENPHAVRGFMITASTS